VHHIAGKQDEIGVHFPDHPCDGIVFHLRFLRRQDVPAGIPIGNKMEGFGAKLVGSEKEAYKGYTYYEKCLVPSMHVFLLLFKQCFLWRMNLQNYRGAPSGESFGGREFYEYANLKFRNQIRINILMLHGCVDFPFRPCN
jgi:hypothetical protein